MTDMYCKHCNMKFQKEDPDTFDWHLEKVHGTNHWTINQKFKELKVIAERLNKN